MKTTRFNKELGKRFKENKQLSEIQFVPERLFGVASWIVLNMFYILIGLAFVLAVVTYIL